jgi:hypothetical protein
LENCETELVAGMENLQVKARGKIQLLSKTIGGYILGTSLSGEREA